MEVVGEKYKPSGSAAFLVYFIPIVIRDRLFTDIVFGNIIDAFTVLSKKAVSEKKDSPVAMTVGLGSVVVRARVE
ncbi:hypothetical protein BC938DRAFT_475316 [Jimgerdemannia flammicorona]|uniref:Uncharacterized protein n=1 Tax=Jimgerdemannia flammicorona TaxID=994334 RepID=A0A433PWP0_9FUNG|nr:hypothetical protein BC938DRAFT_475316 [Jimgerdemannia flammicorona]